MLRFKHFIAEEYEVDKTKHGPPMKSPVYFGDGGINSESARHIKNYVEPHVGSNQEFAITKKANRNFYDHPFDQGEIVHVHSTTQTKDKRGMIHHAAVVASAYVPSKVHVVPISYLHKPRATKNTLRAEEETMNRLNGHIDKIKKEHNLTHVPIVVGPHTYHVSHFESTPGTPKSDIHSVGHTTGPALHLSLKDGSSPKDVQQYGGVSSPAMFHHPEVQKFLKDGHNTFGGSMEKHKGTYYRKIKDPALKSKFVFGNDHGTGKPFGKDNVQAFMQGEVKPVPHASKPGHWTLEANHVMHNHEPIEGAHEPVFFIRKQEQNRRTVVSRDKTTGKPTKIIKGSRAGAYPLGGLSKTAKEL